MRNVVVCVAVILVSIVGILTQDGGTIFLPVVASQPDMNTEGSLLKGYVKECAPSSSSTLISLDQSSKGQGVLVLSRASDGTPIFRSRLDVLALSIEGPLVGDWWAWLVDSENQRLSESVFVHTDSEAGLGRCQHAILVFNKGQAYSQPALIPLAWDSRLSQMGIYAMPAQIQSGESFWHLVEAKWENEQEAAGEGRIYVEVLDSNGQREIGRMVTISYDGDSVTQATEDRPEEEYSFFYDMDKAGNIYEIQVEGYPSDILKGAGLGTPELPFHSIRTNVKLVFRLTVRP